MATSPATRFRLRELQLNGPTLGTPGRTAGPPATTHMTQTNTLNFELNREKAVDKKITQCERISNITFKATYGGIRFWCQTGFYETIKKTLHIWSDLVNNNGRTATVKEKTERNGFHLETIYSLTSLKPRRKQYTINLYHTQSSGLVNGNHLDIFQEHDLPTILALINHLDIDSQAVNRDCKLALQAHQKLKKKQGHRRGSPEKPSPEKGVGRTILPALHPRTVLPPLSPCSPNLMARESLNDLPSPSREECTDSTTDSDYLCIACGTNCTEDGVWCESGLHWVHYKCEDLTPNQIQELEDPANITSRYECVACSALDPEDAAVTTNETSTSANTESTLDQSSSPTTVSLIPLPITVEPTPVVEIPPVVATQPRRTYKAPVHPLGDPSMVDAKGTAPARKPKQSDVGEKLLNTATSITAVRNPAADVPLAEATRPHQTNKAPAQPPQDLPTVNAIDTDAARKLKQIDDREKSLKTKERNLQTREKMLKQQENEVADMAKKLACARAYSVKLEDDVKAEREENRFLRLKLAALHDPTTSITPDNPLKPNYSHVPQQGNVETYRLENLILQARLEAANRHIETSQVLDKQTSLIDDILYRLERPNQKSDPQSSRKKHRIRPRHNKRAESIVGSRNNRDKAYDYRSTWYPSKADVYEYNHGYADQQSISLPSPSPTLLEAGTREDADAYIVNRITGSPNVPTRSEKTVAYPSENCPATPEDPESEKTENLSPNDPTTKSTETPFLEEGLAPNKIT